MTKFTHAAWIALALVLVPLIVQADPPPWAPAHGWRKKHDPYYLGYTGKRWEKDYGVASGRCDAAAIGAAIGGTLGGAVGARVASAENRPVAILAGAAIGALLGAKIGREIDAADRACMGHALELAREKRTVAWTNTATGVAYRLRPLANEPRGAEPCRAFVLESSTGKSRNSTQAIACRSGEGVWELLS
jgi:surface antigen